MSIIRYCAAWLVTLLPLAGVAAEPAAPAKETWQAIANRGQRIGYGHLIETRTEDADGETVVHSDLRLHMAIKRFDGKLTIIIEQQVAEDAAGNLRSFAFRMDNPPSSRLELTGRVAGGVLKLQTTAGGQTTASEVAVPAELKSPVYVDRMLEESPLPPGESRTVSLFDPQLGSIVSIQATGRGPAEFQLPNGNTQAGTKATVEYLTILPGVTIDCYLDAAGKLVLNESQLLGTSTWIVSRDEALREIPADVDLGLTALIKVDRLADSEAAREVVYRITLPDGLPDGLLPAGDTQAVQRIDARTTLVTVTSLRPGATGATNAPPPDARYLASTPMAKTDDPEIVRLAAAGAPAEAAPAEVAKALEKTVHAWLTRKNMSSNLAGASEVVRSKAGDCTEHAVLLAALLRARRIPARVAVGLVYWDQYTAFAGHAWTEAWLDGRWVPLDATQAKGGIGADHIRLGEATLADGDAGLIAGSLATWRLLDKAEIVIERVER